MLTKADKLIIPTKILQVQFQDSSSKETATKVYKFGYFQVRKVCRKLVGAEEANRRSLQTTVNLVSKDNCVLLFFSKRNVWRSLKLLSTTDCIRVIN